MKATENPQGFPYPETNDYGNGALQIQVLAEAVDAKLTQAGADYDTVLEPGTFYTRTTSDLFPILSNANTDLIPLLTGYSYASGNYVFDGGPGIYLVGYSIRMVEVGATTADSTRQLILYVYDYRAEGSSGNPILATERVEFWGNNTNEINSGAITDRFTFAIPVAVYKPESAYLKLEFLHYNAASDVTIQAGSYVWVTRIGDLGV